MSTFGHNIYEPQRCIYGIILMFIYIEHEK